MNVFTLSWHYAWSKPLSAVLTVLVLALGLGSLAVILMAHQRVQQALERDVAGIDVVVGAKGSPLQLILAGVYHLDVPPGNIALADVEALRRHPQVAQLIPISLGDNVNGFRIVGTTPAYPALYGGTLASGQWWQAPMQAVLGADVAKTTGLRVGDRFAGLHGLGAGGHAHGDQPYVVSGVMAASQSVLDRLVLTGIESVWVVHETDMATDADDLAALQAEREITLALIRYSTPLAAVTFPRHVNAATNMQAAAPAYELSRLLRMLSAGAMCCVRWAWRWWGWPHSACSWRCGRPCASAVPTWPCCACWARGRASWQVCCWPRPCGWPRWRVCWAWHWRRG
jgi:putative ABC transport system permease protein